MALRTTGLVSNVAMEVVWLVRQIMWPMITSSIVGTIIRNSSSKEVTSATWKTLRRLKVLLKMEKHEVLASIFVWFCNTTTIETWLSGLNRVQRLNIYIQEELFTMPICDIFMRESTKFHFIFLFILVCFLLDNSNSFAYSMNNVIALVVVWKLVWLFIRESSTFLG